MDDIASQKGAATPGRMVRPAPRLAPLPPDHTPELAESFAIAQRRLGFVPNSLLIMQRRPEAVQAFASLLKALNSPDSPVSPQVKQMVAFMVSNASGCQYCIAHTGSTAARMGIDADKFDNIWNYQTSPLFTDAERAALDVAVASGCVPNAVTDEMFANLRKHWNEEQIVEIVGTIAVFGFLNRWNDTLATPLEAEPLAFGRERLAETDWNPDKHVR